MSERYFLVDDLPFELVEDGGPPELRAMDPVTGVMRPSGREDELRARGTEVSFETYKAKLDTLRGPILARATRMAVHWHPTGDFEQSYAATIDGRRWTCGMGEFPEEPLYLIWVEGALTYSVDDWPSAWTKAA